MQAVDPNRFKWLLPGERRVALWGANRVRKVQGNSKDLVAGAYVILAAIWGSTGGVIVVVGVILDAISKTGVAGSTLLLVGLVPLAIGGIRIAQSRNERQQIDP